MPRTTFTTKHSELTVQIEQKHDSNTVRVLSGDRLMAHRQQDAGLIPEVCPQSTKMWQLYKQARHGNLVVRSGLGLCGCYDDYDPNAAPNPRHVESVTEHASGCITLAQGLVNNYQEILPAQLHSRLTFLLRYHDIGENSYADRPDDGSQNVSEKEAVELAEFAMLTLNFTSTFRETAIKDFAQFLDAKTAYDSNDQECFRVGQLARLIDKFEAVLSGVFYEKNGIQGDLKNKQLNYGPLTDQDQYYVDATGGASALVDVWSAHLVCGYYQFQDFPYLLDVLRAAVIDTRGLWFPWFDEFCAKHHIPESSIQKPSRSI